MEDGEIIFAEKKTAQGKSETDARHLAESGKSESGVDV